MTSSMAEQASIPTVYDAAIVGGGMVGGTLAILLARQGFHVAVVEAGDMMPQWAVEQVDSRVSALTAASQQLFEALALWPAMVDRRVTPYTKMDVWDGTGNGAVQFDAKDVMAPVLGHIVENSVITDTLHAAMQQQPRIDCFAAAKVNAVSDIQPADALETSRTLMFSDGRALTARIVIAADGAKSPLRRMLGIGTEAWDTHQMAIATTVTHELPHQQCARQVFLATGPLAFLPLDASASTRHHTSSIVWSANIAEAERLMALSDQAFAESLATAFENRLGLITPLSKRTVFPLIQRHAKRYVLPSFALVGDAAHGIHPLAGQGANLGFLDVAVLTEELVKARQQGAPLSDVRVLMRYERRRRADNATMLKAMEAFCRGFGEQNPWVVLARNAGLSAVNRFMPLKRFFIRQALGQRSNIPTIMQP